MEIAQESVAQSYTRSMIPKGRSILARGGGMSNDAVQYTNSRSFKNVYKGRGSIEPSKLLQGMALGLGMSKGQSILNSGGGLRGMSLFKMKHYNPLESADEDIGEVKSEYKYEDVGEKIHTSTSSTDLGDLVRLSPEGRRKHGEEILKQLVREQEQEKHTSTVLGVVVATTSAESIKQITSSTTTVPAKQVVDAPITDSDEEEKEQYIKNRDKLRTATKKADEEEKEKARVAQNIKNRDELRAAKQKADEEEKVRVAKQKADEEEEEKARVAQNIKNRDELIAAKQKADENEAKKKVDEAKKKADENEAKKKVDEANEAKKKADENEAKKKVDEANEAKKKVDEEEKEKARVAQNIKNRDELRAAKQKADEEEKVRVAKQKADEEEKVRVRVATNKADEEEKVRVAKKKADDEQIVANQKAEDAYTVRRLKKEADDEQIAANQKAEYDLEVANQKAEDEEKTRVAKKKADEEQHIKNRDELRAATQKAEDEEKARVAQQKADDTKAKKTSSLKNEPEIVEFSDKLKRIAMDPSGTPIKDDKGVNYWGRALVTNNKHRTYIIEEKIKNKWRLVLGNSDTYFHNFTNVAKITKFNDNITFNSMGDMVMTNNHRITLWTKEFEFPVKRYT